jgi:hypothetical protein
MSITKLIPIATALAMAAAATGNLPRILVQVKLAQLQLIKDSQASKWGKPFLLPVTK